MIDGLTLAMLVALSSPAEAGPRPVAAGPGTQPAGVQIKPGQQIVAMGDSITQAGGYLRVMDAVFAQQYADLKIPRVISAGISGEKAEDMVKRFERDVIARKPDIVTISVGINDVWHRMDRPHDPQVLEQYRRNVERMVRMAREAGARVIILSPTVIEEDAESEGNRRLRLYIEAGQKVALKLDAEYVNLNEMFLKVIARRNQDNDADGRAAEPLTTDGVHMTPLGDTLMAVGVLRALGVPDEKIAATDLSEVFKKD
jgi:acyl-CoA thioesterase I